MSRKMMVIIGVIVVWMCMVSMGRYVEPVIEVVEEETRECINRIDLEGYEFDTGVFHKDGSINRVVLWNQARTVAKVLYGTARTNSREQKETAVWCIINRVESEWYPNTIDEVCNQSQQWKGYDKTNPVEDELADLAFEILYKYYSSGRNFSGKDFVYMSATSSDIVLRDTFNIGEKTRYWRSTDGVSTRGDCN